MAETYKIDSTYTTATRAWQVVCYQYGILTITGENQAMISQLGYFKNNILHNYLKLMS
jgi:hypothetical protein